MEKVKQKTNKNLFYFLLGLILLRPCLDILSQYEFEIHPVLPEFNLNIIIGGLVFFICLIFLLKNLKTTLSTPLSIPIFLFLGLCFLSIFYSLDASESVKEFIRLASIFLLYFLAYQLVQDRKDWLLMLKIILVSYILPGAFALVQLIIGSGITDDFGGFSRIYGTFAHSNPFAFYTFFILGLVLCLILDKTISSQNLHIGLWAIAIILTFFLFATYTRSAIACFFIFILILGIFKYRKLLLAGLFVFLIAYFFSDVFQQKIWDMITLDPYGSVVWRFRLWRDMIPISLWQPWLGHGLETFTNLVEFYRGFDWGSLEAHNDYLKIFVENGILGLIAFFWLIIGLMLYLFRIFRKTLSQEKTVSLGILTIVLTLFIASFFDNILCITALQWNFWILLGGWMKINYKR